MLVGGPKEGKRGQRQSPESFGVQLGRERSGEPPQDLSSPPERCPQTAAERSCQRRLREEGRKELGCKWFSNKSANQVAYLGSDEAMEESKYSRRA